MRVLAALLAAVSPLAALGANFDVEPIPDLPLSSIPPVPAAEKAPSAPAWKFSLGGGLSYGPRYEGSAGDRVRFMPLLEASYSNGHFFASIFRGVGYNFSESRDMQYGVRLMPGHRRKESDDPRLHGMGDIGFTPEAGLFFNQRFAPWYISGGITGGTLGTHVELGGGVGFPLSPVDRLRLGANLNWGNAKYNQTYFGVTPEQAAASGNVLDPYSAGAGVKDYTLTANWLRNHGAQWFSNDGVSYKWLVGSAKESPLTQRSSMASVNFLVGYRF